MIESKALPSCTCHFLAHSAKITHLLVEHSSSNSGVQLTNVDIFDREELFLELFHIILHEIVIEFGLLIKLSSFFSDQHLFTLCNNFLGLGYDGAHLLGNF